MTVKRSTPPPAEQWFRRLTLVVSNILKLAGLYIALRAVGRPPVDPFELALSAFMMSGAQVSEQAVLRLINSFLGREESAPAPRRRNEDEP